MKYRLKKDTPFYKKGTEFCEDWCHKGMLLNDDCIVIADLNELDNPDEWFEEIKKPKWARKQIRQVIFDDSRRDIIGWKYTDMEYVYIKDYCYYDSQTSFSFHEEGTRMKFRFFEKTNSPERDNVLRYFNQLVRDGYIEIQDNPNIVWEDENEHDN